MAELSANSGDLDQPDQMLHSVAYESLLFTNYTFRGLETKMDYTVNVDSNVLLNFQCQIFTEYSFS